MKKIKQWFKGLLFLVMCTIASVYLCMVSIIFPIENFIEMMNTTGKEFIGNFIFFIITLLCFIFIPYLLYKIFEDYEETKNRNKKV